jgi:hypothetical protein
MAKNTNKRAASLKVPAAKGSVIGDNSKNAPSDSKAFTALLHELAKLGDESRNVMADANKKQLNAGLAFGKAVKAGTAKLEPMADSNAAVKAFAPHLFDAKLGDKQGGPFKALRSQFRSFANDKVIECADYAHIESARKGKDFFQAAYKLNVAIKNAAADKPNVNAAFTAKALERKESNAGKPDRTAKGYKKAAEKALKSLRAALADFKAKSVRKAVEGLSDAQLKALDTAVANFL